MTSQKIRCNHTSTRLTLKLRTLSVTDKRKHLHQCDTAVCFEAMGVRLRRDRTLRMPPETDGSSRERDLPNTTKLPRKQKKTKHFKCSFQSSNIFQYLSMFATFGILVLFFCSAFLTFINENIRSWMFLGLFWPLVGNFKLRHFLPGLNLKRLLRELDIPVCAQSSFRVTCRSKSRKS